MPGTDYRNGMPMGMAPGGYQSRTAEFSGGAFGGGSTTHSMQQSAPTSFVPSGVLNSIPNPNGESMATYDQNRILRMNRSF